MNYKLLSVFLAGLLLGVACKAVKDTFVDTAEAADPACTQWEAREQRISDDIPEGWEPFGYEVVIDQDYDLGIALRRCTSD